MIKGDDMDNKLCTFQEFHRMEKIFVHLSRWDGWRIEHRVQPIERRRRRMRNRTAKGRTTEE